MSSEFDDVLGTPYNAKPGTISFKRERGRPTKQEMANRQSELTTMPTAKDGVTVDWFVKLFRLDRASAVRKLKSAPVFRFDTKGTPYYDVPVAAAYLIDPARDRVDFLDSLKPEQLPERLRSGYWDAKTKEMKYRLLAGELWPTDSVMEVLADTFQIISAKTRLWADDLEEVSELSEKQRKLLGSMIDDLITEVKKGLIERAESKVSESYLAELDK